VGAYVNLHPFRKEKQPDPATHRFPAGIADQRLRSRLPRAGTRHARVRRAPRSRAFVTIETGKLLKRGLLTKLPDPKDRRRVCLSITKKGADLLHRLAPTQAQVNDVLFEFLDAAQFRQFRGLVDPMTECGDRSVALLEYLSRHQV
jgi:hypothetical protein